MSNAHAHLAYPLGFYRAKACLRERTLENFGGRSFFSFFHCNPLKLHETTKEKLGKSKEKYGKSKQKFGVSKKILGNKKKKLGVAGDFERAPAALHER